MKKIVNPKQIQLFDPFDSVLTPKTRKRLLDGWPGVFRHIILDLMPDELLVDTHYTGDDNVQFAEQQGVELVWPVPSGPGKTKDNEYEQLNVDDFDIDEQSEEVVCCPAGHEPQSSEYNSETGKTKTVMPESDCSQCEFFEQCPVEKVKGQYGRILA